MWYLIDCVLIFVVFLTYTSGQSCIYLDEAKMNNIVFPADLIMGKH